MKHLCRNKTDRVIVTKPKAKSNRYSLKSINENVKKCKLNRAKKELGVRS